MWYSYSKDGGRTWAAPVRVDKTDATDIWPWIAVGSPDRVAIAWFGNDNQLPDENAELAGEGDPWNVYVAQTLTGLGCSKSSSAGFTVTKATPAPFHVGTVCMGGTVCQAEVVDRRLGDYFTIDIDCALTRSRRLDRTPRVREHLVARGSRANARAARAGLRL